MSYRQTFTDAVASYLKARPNQWVSADDLAAVGGRWAWRTRVSQARREYGMQIDNVVKTRPNGSKESLYRYVVTDLSTATQATLGFGEVA